MGSGIWTGVRDVVMSVKLAYEWGCMRVVGKNHEYRCVFEWKRWRAVWSEEFTVFG